MIVKRFEWGCPVDVEINDQGVIDEEAEKVFTRGQCHSLALALHRQTGWPIIGFIDRYDDPEIPGHCVVYCPQLDEYVDICGIGALIRWQKRWDAKPIPLATEAVENGLKAYLPIQPEVAEPFAKTVLAKLLDIHGELVIQNTGGE